MKIRPVGAELFHTDRNDEVNIRFFSIFLKRLRLGRKEIS